MPGYRDRRNEVRGDIGGGHSRGVFPGKTRTIAIYDRVQAFDSTGAGVMSATLLFIYMLAIVLSYIVTAPGGTRHHD